MIRRKMLVEWVIPPAIQETIRRIRTSKHLTSADRGVLKENAKLNGRHMGQRCFILATGPSIKAQNLGWLRDEICISVSNFYVHPEYQNIRPKYHCVPAYHLPITEEAFVSWLREIDSVVQQATMILPLTDKEKIEHIGAFSKAQRHYLAFTEQPKMPPDFTSQILLPQSITIVALQLAIYMGCSPIYLLGVDHDWILNLEKSRHFYEASESVLQNEGYNEWQDTSFESTLNDYVNLWKQYRQLKDVVEPNRIFNATPGSLLDIFPRVSFSSLQNSVSKESS